MEMKLSELQRMFAFAIGLTTTICSIIFIYVRKQNKNINHSTSAKTARFILSIAIFMEFVHGIIHFVYPYNCHILISGIADGFGIKDEMNAMTAVAMMTYAWGVTSLLLASISLLPFLIDDPNLFATLYTLVVNIVFRLVANVGLWFGLFGNIYENLPAYMKGINMEKLSRQPPGKHGAIAELVLLGLGVAMTVIARKGMCRKCDKKGE